MKSKIHLVHRSKAKTIGTSNPENEEPVFDPIRGSCRNNYVIPFFSSNQMASVAAIHGPVGWPAGEAPTCKPSKLWGQASDPQDLEHLTAPVDEG